MLESGCKHSSTTSSANVCIGTRDGKPVKHDTVREKEKKRKGEKERRRKGEKETVVRIFVVMRKTNAKKIQLIFVLSDTI